MKTIVWKAYWDFMKEEAWLNKMSAQGFALSDYSWCRYVFEETPPGKYIYRLELLENLPTHPESHAYLRFLEESGVTVVATYMRWAFLRREASEGPFEIYTDPESIITYYQRVIKFWTFIIWLELIAGGTNLCIIILHLLDGNPSRSFMQLIFAMIPIAIGIGFMKMIHPLKRTVKRLKNESI